jgi:hypothetical protein
MDSQNLPKQIPHRLKVTRLRFSNRSRHGIIQFIVCNYTKKTGKPLGRGSPIIQRRIKENFAETLEINNFRSFFACLRVHNPLEK